jgi:hypothetical protein
MNETRAMTMEMNMAEPAIGRHEAGDELANSTQPTALTR